MKFAGWLLAPVLCLAGCATGPYDLPGPRHGINDDIPTYKAPANLRIGDEEAVLAVSEGGGVIAVMPAWSDEDRFYVIDTVSRSVTEYRSSRLKFHNVAVAADGKSFVVLTSDGQPHALAIMQCRIGGDCRDIASFRRKIVTSLATSPDGQQVYYASLHVDGFETNPSDFLTYNQFEVSKFPIYAQAGHNSFASDIDVIDIASGQTSRLYDRIKFQGRLYPTDKGLVLQGFTDEAMLAAYDRTYKQISYSLISEIGVPLFCATATPCRTVDLVAEDPDFPARLAGAARNGDIAVMVPPREILRYSVYRFAVGAPGKTSMRTVQNVPQPTAVPQDIS